MQMDLSQKAAAEIDAQPMIEVRGLGAEEGSQTPPKVDYAQYHIKDLRSLAASLGIAGFFTMRKVDLITKLEEKQ